MQVMPFENVELAGLYAQIMAPTHVVRFEREKGVWQVRLGGKKRIENENNSDVADGDVVRSACNG
jgi:hypothetical protein